MQTSSVVNRHFRQEKIGDVRSRLVAGARTIPNSEVGRRSENLVASFSLAVLVTTVLVLIYQAIVC